MEVYLYAISVRAIGYTDLIQFITIAIKTVIKYTHSIKQKAINFIFD